MNLHHCRCLQEYTKILLQRLSAHWKAPGGAMSISKYLDVLVRATEGSGRFAYGFQSNLHFADLPQCTSKITRSHSPCWHHEGLIVYLFTCWNHSHMVSLQTCLIIVLSTFLRPIQVISKIYVTHLNSPVLYNWRQSINWQVYKPEENWTMGGHCGWHSE